ncbi:hypothetical protein Pdw03_4435 [Penicillium digitatum]|uniref:Uncharacterized protein n=1 Tax=Penicillium digitatum TaxID=36651 RepID=A0A7T7BJ06_PENDI|nr:hypothetical protein Pdw03_4435 [Penicillium digitatum]
MKSQSYLLRPRTGRYHNFHHPGHRAKHLHPSRNSLGHRAYIRRFQLDRAVPSFVVRHTYCPGEIDIAMRSTKA